MPTIDQIIDEPQTLKGLFPPDSDDEDETIANNGDTGGAAAAANNDSHVCFEIQTIAVAGRTLRVRQYDYHSHNANRVWPGTFNLAEYLLERVPIVNSSTGVKPSDALSDSDDATTTANEDQQQKQHPFKHQWGRILELGTATGLLAMRLAMASSVHSSGRYRSSLQLLGKGENEGCDTTTDGPCCGCSRRGDSTATSSDQAQHCSYCYCCTSIVTSDVKDEYGDIASNLRFNYQLNQTKSDATESGNDEKLGFTRPPLHVPHTWGTGWEQSVVDAIDDIRTSVEKDDEATACVATGTRFDTIVASDILLYVAAYPALVQTLTEIMSLPRNDGTDYDPATIFVMSWNRRMKESAEFFRLMEQAGFSWTHQGKCIYTFVLSDNAATNGRPSSR